MTSHWRKPFLFLASEFVELSVPVSDKNILSIQYDIILPSTWRKLNSLRHKFTLYIEHKPTWYLLLIYPLPDLTWTCPLWNVNLSVPDVPTPTVHCMYRS
jgi:hypothetical protein